MLIMGGTGTVGSHLLRELLPDRERFEIVATARSAASAARLREAGYEAVTLDLERNETLDPALRGVDTLFMLKPYSMDYLIQSKRVIDAAVRAGVRHVVNLGSFGADDTPWASIGWNRLVEAYLRVSGLGQTTLRPNFFMDNVPARTDRETGRIIHYFGSTPVSWIAAADIARVAAEVSAPSGRFCRPRPPARRRFALDERDRRDHCADDRAAVPCRTHRGRVRAAAVARARLAGRLRAAVRRLHGGHRGRTRARDWGYDHDRRGYHRGSRDRLAAIC
jgi:uncharacterized protein YbjT (DUF2867 family)